MNYVDVRQPGDPDVLRLVKGPVPVPGSTEVLIRVAAAGVNRADLTQRAGRYALPAGANPILGLEVSGEIIATGIGVGGLEIGDRVCALTNGGGYAEYCAVPAAQCLPWPSGCDAIAAASLPEACCTTWANVFTIGRLAAGETILIHGGSSGIGVIAVQAVKALGGRVLVTAGSAEKTAACLELGADAAINYYTEDFQVRVRELTEGRGVDVVLDMVGAPYLERNLSCLADGGRLVLIGLQQGAIADRLDLRAIMTRRLAITGSTLRARTDADKASIIAHVRDNLWPLLEKRLMKPVVHRMLPFSDVREAHRLMESGGHIGKIVLAWSCGEGATREAPGEGATR